MGSDLSKYVTLGIVNGTKKVANGGSTNIKNCCYFVPTLQQD